MGTDVDNELKELRDDLRDVKKTVGEIAKKGDNIAAALASFCKDASSNAQAADEAVGSVAKVVASLAGDVGNVMDASSENAKRLADSVGLIDQLMQKVVLSERKHDASISTCQQAIHQEVLDSNQRVVALIKDG